MLPLPIDGALLEITAALRERGALVLVAEPGAGKTTRVPPAMLDAGLAGDGEILVLEPRRLAARMAAQRVADERGERLGETVGYEVRFQRVAGERTRLRFLTEGILTRRLAADPMLRGVSAVVLDEFHERHLHGDVALALLTKLRAGPRPELRLCVMSATLDAEPLAAFLGAPVLRVPGRVFPVEIEHATEESERPLGERVASALRRLLARGLDGDVLVFLPGASEIRRARDACEALAREHDLWLLPLHGELPMAEQDRAVAPAPKRKVILSTNIAETSLTIDGVVAVIDSGTARVMKHSPWSGLPSLELAKVSRAAAAQRSGRAGRTRPGVTWRLYTQHDHDTRLAHDVPEVRRADLAEAVLALRAAGIDDVMAAPWYEPPPAAAVDAATRLLRRLGAIDARGLTATGRALLSLPLHPRVGRLFLEAQARGLGRRAATLAASVSERELRLSARTSFGERAGATHSGPSDVLARMEAFESVTRGQSGDADEGSVRERCRRYGLDATAYAAIARARDALARRLDAKLRTPRPEGADAEDRALLASILAAFPDRVARRRTARAPDIVMAQGGALKVAAESVVLDAEWMVVVEADEGRRGPTARVASAIEPDWLLDLFPDDVHEERVVRFDEDHERVEVRSELRYEGLVLDESRRTDLTGPEVSAALADAALRRGPATFCAEGSLQRFLARARFLGAHRPDFPRFDDADLRERLLALCEGRRSFRELRDADLLGALVHTLPPKDAAALTRLAPETHTLPGGRRLQIQYEEGRPPWAESRLQDFFGMADGPKLVDGRVPVVLHLNAPSGRAVQVTTDLAGFWARHYPSIRKELMRKYPRHSWPEDPRNAEPPKPGRLRP